MDEDLTNFLLDRTVGPVGVLRAHLLDRQPLDRLQALGVDRVALVRAQIDDEELVGRVGRCGRFVLGLRLRGGTGGAVLLTGGLLGHVPLVIRGDGRGGAGADGGQSHQGHQTQHHQEKDSPDDRLFGFHSSPLSGGEFHPKGTKTVTRFRKGRAEQISRNCMLIVRTIKLSLKRVKDRNLRPITEFLVNNRGAHSCL